MNFRKISPRLLKINMYVDGGISIKSLIHDCGNEGSILVYNLGFDKSFLTSQLFIQFT